MADEADGAGEDALRHALVEVGAGPGDLASVARPLLAALRTVTGLESTFLTSIDRDRQVQWIQVADNGGSIAHEEGLEVPWGDSEAALALGIQTYVSAPVVLADGEVFGTLCGISSNRIHIDAGTESLLAVFGRIIADAVLRDRQLSEASDRASESDRLLRARSQFVAAAQHRLKTPLTVILGWSTLLLEDESEIDEDERRTALLAIARAARHATAEVSSMLSESEAASLALDVSVGPVDVVAITRRSTADLATLSDRHHIEVEVESDVPAAHADPEIVRIVLEHLIDNAVKYSPDGGEVRVGVACSDAGRVRLSVCDEGIGLPTGVDIFAPFTRGVDRAVIPGTGLGLHVVQSLVHAVSGEVTARRNVDGPGSTVTVLLPRAAAGR